MSLFELILNSGFDFFLMLTVLYIFSVISILYFFKRSIINIYDPVVPTLIILVIPAMVGYFISMYENITISSWIILIYLATFIILFKSFPLRLIKTNNFIPKHFQLIVLLTCIFVLVLNIIFNMLIPNDIPLLSPLGNAGRFSSTEHNRILVWLKASLSGTSIFLFAYSDYKIIRKIAMIGIILNFITAILFASKGAILIPIYVCLAVLCFSKIKGEQSRIRKYKKILFVFLGFVGIIIPIYFGIIGVSNNSDKIFRLLAYRLFGGFDQLIPASQLDLASQWFSGDKAIDTNIVTYQLLPFAKLFFHISPKFSSIGQYIVFKNTGTYIDHAFTFPNSNLILETILTSGVIIGYYIYLVELVFVFYLRKIVLEKKNIAPFSMTFYIGIIMAPFGLFISGQDWINQMVIRGGVFFSCYAIYLFLLYASKRKNENMWVCDDCI